MARDRLVVGIDVGSTKMCTLIARVSEDEQLEVIGAGVTRSDALKKGVVASVEQAENDIRTSILKAEQQSGFKILSAYVSITGSHIQTEETRGTITVRRPERPISADEVYRVLEAARASGLPADREVVDILPRHYTVDGQEEIASPIGMMGTRLEIAATLISGSRTAIQSLSSCVERAGVQIDALVPQAAAAGESVLSPAERSQGVLLIDMGGGTTDLGVFAGGALIFASTIPAGGFQITNDIATRLRTPFFSAEEVKVRHGQAFSSDRDDDHIIPISAFDSGESSSVSSRLLCDTIEDRLVDTFELVRKRLARAGYEDGLPAGAVLVGGTAQLSGIRRLAAEILDMPVRIGVPGGAIGLGEQLNGPAFAASVGLLRWGLKHGDDVTVGGSSQRLEGAVASVIAWLRGFLP